MFSLEFVKLLKYHFYVFKNINFTEQFRKTAAVSIEHSFNIEKPNFNWCQEKENPGEKSSVRG